VATLLAMSDDDLNEFWRCALAVPVALLAATLLSLLTPQLAMRLFGAHVHELGHFAASLFTGHPAMPSIGITYTYERDTVTPIGLAAILGWLLYWTIRRGHRAFSFALAILLVVQAIGTLALGDPDSWALIVWAGDGVGMVLATLLVASFFFVGDTAPRWLRWVLLAVGACTFTDIFLLWLRASHHHEMPFVGDGRADFERLVNGYGWPEAVMVRRYVSTGFFCLIALAPLYFWRVREAWKAHAE
jgi:hypothetical protein